MPVRLVLRNFCTQVKIHNSEYLHEMDLPVTDQPLACAMIFSWNE